jgi:hypothetical protein
MNQFKEIVEIIRDGLNRPSIKKTKRTDFFKNKKSVRQSRPSIAGTP